MKDFPVFTTQNGVASLILKEIPYRQTAYIRILDSLEPEALLKECVEFCVAVGAEHIYATGHRCLEKYPVFTKILQMGCSTDDLPETDAALFPMQEKTQERWRSLYNEKMKDVPLASYMTQKDTESLLQEKKAYFVHRDKTLLGIGIMDGEKLEAIASVISGAGRDVVLALCSIGCSGTITLEVASKNKKAIKLYTKLGFLIQEERTVWYWIQ